MMDDTSVQPMQSTGEGRVMCMNCPARYSFLCSGLEDEQMRFLAARANRQSVRKGQTLILQGDSANDVYNVVEGDVILSRFASDGRRQILGFLRPGDFIGLTLHDQYEFSAEALTDARLCRFDRRSIEELIERFPQMDRQVRRMGAAAVDGLLDLVFSLGRRSAEEKVAFFLHHLAERHGCCNIPAEHFDLPMTRADMADYLGLTLETVSRIMSRMKKQGVIALPAPNKVEILDLSALEALMEIETA